MEKSREPAQILRLIAVPQTVLMAATFLNSHVQIITRIASGYPIWYLWLAWAIQGHLGVQPRRISRYLVRWMVMYAMIQGGLYASFLPPA
jgi:GPI mannosyltransferase 2